MHVIPLHQQQVAAVVISDEPTGNPDIQNVAILAAALNEYDGTLIVVQLLFITNSTLRFCFLPSSVSLEETGFELPEPW